MSKMQISRAAIERMQKQAKSAAARASKMKAKAEELTGQVMTTTTIGGTAFLWGYVQNRFRGDSGQPGIEILGIPVDLGAGIAAHLMGLFMGGQYQSVMHNVGNGSLAAYLNTMGSGMGAKHYSERHGGAPAAAQGRHAFSSGSGMADVTNEELRRIAQKLAA